MSKIYLAGPFFNARQIQLVQDIEDLVAEHPVPSVVPEAIEPLKLYSPRRDSGSALMTSEDKRHWNNWIPVFESNVEAMDDAEMCIAILDYLLPEDVQLGVATDVSQGEGWCDVSSFTPLQLPDTGTVWELGYMNNIAGAVVVGFFMEKPKALNLMLSHCCDALVYGLDELREFLKEYQEDRDAVMEGQSRFCTFNQFDGKVI